VLLTEITVAKHTQQQSAFVAGQAFAASYQTMQTSVPPDPVSDPDELASLVVQQYLRDTGFETGTR
jgi:hypothetical protein